MKRTTAILVMFIFVILSPIFNQKVYGQAQNENVMGENLFQTSSYFLKSAPDALISQSMPGYSSAVVTNQPITNTCPATASRVGVTLKLHHKRTACSGACELQGSGAEIIGDGTSLVSGFSQFFTAVGVTGDIPVSHGEDIETVFGAMTDGANASVIIPESFSQLGIDYVTAAFRKLGQSYVQVRTRSVENGWNQGDTEVLEINNVCYGTNPTATPTATATQTPTQTPTATVAPVCDTPIMWRSKNLIETYESGGNIPVPLEKVGNKWVIDYRISRVFNHILPGFNQAIVGLGVTGFSGEVELENPINWTVTINGMPFGLTSGNNSVAIQGPADGLDVHLYGELPDLFGVDAPAVSQFYIKLMMDDACDYNVLTDSDFEAYPESPKWELLDGGLMGRLNTDYMTGIDKFIDGGPICGKGFQRIGLWQKQSIGYPTARAGPIFQEFKWPGGPGHIKFKFKAFNVSGQNITHIYLADTAGTDVHDIFGFGDSGGSGWALTWWDWTDRIGFDLPGGVYKIVFDFGDGVEAQDPTSYIAIDDLAIGKNEQEAECYEYVTDPPPQLPTPTASPTSRTPTATTTAMGTRTATITKTPGPLSGTVTITTTANPTRTRTSGPTAIPSFTRVPTQTRTPYGFDYHTITPVTGGATPTGTITPGTGTGTPGPGTPTLGPWDIGGDMPPDGNGGSGSCSRPTNPWSLSWWIDYEFCRVEYAVSWQPGHSATIVAIPAAYNNVEPIRSVRELQTGINTMNTQVAGYAFSNDAFVNGGGPQTPSTSMFDAPKNSPWNGAPLTLGPLPTGNVSAFSSTCTHKLTTKLGSVLAPGFCFTLNMVRDLGLLIWMNWLIDILAVASLVSSVLKTIQFYPLLYNGKGGGKGQE
jgi:hypothetical protein